MRGLILWLLLLSAFGAAALLREHWLGADRAARDEAWSGQPAEDGFARLSIGTSAGVPPISYGDSPGGLWSTDVVEGPEPTTPRPEPTSGASLSYETPPPTDFELVVRPGQTLSQICESFYGTSRGGLVDKLARYNGVKPDRIRAGDRLMLPGRETLEEQP